MNEFNVLLAAATNGTPSGSLFDALFARYIAPQESWRELESPLPITILAAGEDLIDYRIFGNTENGESVGERTENLFDDNAPDYEVGCFYDQNNTKIANHVYAESGYIPVKAGTYLIVILARGSGRVLIANFFDTNKNFDSNLLYRIGPGHNNTLTIPSDGYVRFNIFLGTAYTNAFMFIEGSTAPTSYIPYGYKLPMVVRSENLFDKDTVTPNSLIDSTTGEVHGYKYYDTTGMMEIENDFVITFVKNVSSSAQSLRIAFYDAQNNFISFIGTANAVSPYNIEIPNGTKKVRVSYSNGVYPGSAYPNNLFIGMTAPTEYIPYYRDEENIYIGSDPLAEDEYVDFGEQKVYRVEGGTLTPTDPPVPIPALPTIEGETIIDYNPSTTPAVEPEKMYIKYKPQ